MTVTRKEYPVVLHLPGFLKPGRCSIAMLLLSIGSFHSASFFFFPLFLCAILAHVVRGIHRRGRGDRRGANGDRPMDVVFQTDGHLFGTTYLRRTENAEKGKEQGIPFHPHFKKQQHSNPSSPHILCFFIFFRSFCVLSLRTLFRAFTAEGAEIAEELTVTVSWIHFFPD